MADYLAMDSLNWRLVGTSCLLLFAVLQPVELRLPRYTVRDLKAFGKLTASQLSDGFRNRKNFHFYRLCFCLFGSISLQQESVAKSVSLFKKIPNEKWATYLTANLLTAQIKDLFAYLKIVYLKLSIRK